MDTLWRVSLLGGLRAEGPNRVVTRFRTQKTASLLAYLAYYRDRPHPRDLLMEILWPEDDLDAARNKLRLSLSSLRRQFEPPGVPAGAVISADRAFVRLSGRAVTTDVAEFEAVIESAARAGSGVDVAEPAELIDGPDATDFNIGRRIRLEDFTPAEAASLVNGLGRPETLAELLLQRVLYWMGGHPYLTQRLCKAAAEDLSVTGGAGVDRKCEELFLSPQGRDQDENLLFVRARLLRGDGDGTGLLALYEQVCRGEPVQDDDTNTLVRSLKLSGIVRTVDVYLQVRNRIYERVFDREWARANWAEGKL